MGILRTGEIEKSIDIELSTGQVIRVSRTGQKIGIYIRRENGKYGLLGLVTVTSFWRAIKAFWIEKE